MFLAQHRSVCSDQAALEEHFTFPPLPEGLLHLLLYYNTNTQFYTLIFYTLDLVLAIWMTKDILSVCKFCKSQYLL